MRGARLGGLALGIVLFGVASGCRSLPSPPPPMEGGLVLLPDTLPPEAERAAKVHALYSIGIHHELADEYDRAADAYRQAYELDPDQERLALRLASMLALQRQPEEALRTVEDFRVRQPTSEQAIEWLAAFYGSTGEGERVIRLYTQLTEQNPKNPEAWIRLAAAYKRAGDTNAVKSTLEKAVTQAQPPTLLQQELVRMHLAGMQTAKDEEQLQQERQQAIRLLQQIAENLPGDLDTLNLLGELLFKNGQLPEAVAAYEKVLRIQPRDTSVKQRLVQVYLAMNDEEQAMNILADLTKNQKSPINLHVYIADMQLQAGRTNRAMEQLQLATAEEPTEPAFWLKLAALQADDNPKQAETTLRKALQNIPGNPQILEVMGLMRLAQNRYKQAAEFLQQAYDAAMADDPNEPMTPLFYYHIALASTHLGQTERAADWLERAMEMEPGILPLYMQRAITGTKSYRRNAAKVLRALAQGAGQKNASILAHLAVLNVYQKKMAQAIQGFDEVLALAQTDPLQATALTPWFYFWFGVALDEAKQGERSVEMFEKCIELAPDYAEARNYLAYVWALQGIRLDEALRHIQVALSEDPYNAAFLDTLGWVYYQMGEYEDALDVLQQADELRPDDPEIMDHLEKAREKLGR